MAESLNKNEKFFISEVERFIKYFNLINWEIEVCPTIEEGGDYRASCIVKEEYDGSISGRIGIIEYDKPWLNHKDITLEEISKTAFHEVIELLLIRLRNFSGHREIFISNSQIDSEVHSIIRTLENTIFKDFLKPKLIKGNKNGNKK